MNLRFVLLLVLAITACNVYPQHDGEFDAGPVDPFNFPPPYLGALGDRTKAARGSFTEIKAYSRGQAIGYFSFPFAPSLSGSSKTPPDPLRLSTNGAPYSQVPAPRAYVFDPQPGVSAFPSTPHCAPPLHYTYDPRVDDVPLNVQGPIFTALPNATYSFTQVATWNYEPIVAEVGVNNNNAPCQNHKSETSLPKNIVSEPIDTYYLAWPLIDPGAAVYRVGQSINNSGGITAQHFGWYNHYLVAYLDGGYIPTSNDKAADGTPVVHMVVQNLYYPRSTITTTVNGKSTSAAGAIGQGYDVVDAPRGDAQYSPVCNVYSYDPGNATPDQLPKDANTIRSLYGPTFTLASTPYIFCLQVQ